MKTIRSAVLPGLVLLPLCGVLLSSSLAPVHTPGITFQDTMRNKSNRYPDSPSVKHRDRHTTDTTYWDPNDTVYNQKRDRKDTIPYKR